MSDRNFTDSLRRELPPDFREQSDRFPSDAGLRSRDGRGRGVFKEGNKINLGNVVWYLAVFASFTIIAIYTDYALKLIRKRKKSIFATLVSD